MGGGISWAEYGDKDGAQRMGTGIGTAHQIGAKGMARGGRGHSVVDGVRDRVKPAVVLLGLLRSTRM